VFLQDFKTTIIELSQKSSEIMRIMSFLFELILYIYINIGDGIKVDLYVCSVLFKCLIYFFVNLVITTVRSVRVLIPDRPQDSKIKFRPFRTISSKNFLLF
jgi:hypothetical protein